MASRIAQKRVFYTEMAKLLAGGFGIREAASVLRDAHLSVEQMAALDGMEKGLSAGMSITDAYAESGNVSAMERSIIHAGEKGGRLAAAFQHLAEYFELLDNSRRHVLRGAIYPAVILHMGVFISVVPQSLMAGTSHPWRELMFTLLALYIGALLIFMAIRALAKAAPHQPKLDLLLNRIPWLGKARQYIAMARFTKVYHLCLMAGLTISETVATASAAAHSGAILKSGEKLAAFARAGELLGPAFLASPVFPKAFARSYATAEVSGSLDKDMARWNQFFREEAETAVQRFATALPKVVYALVMIFIAWRILGFWSSYYAGLDAIGE